MKSLDWINKFKCPSLATITANNNEIKVLPKLEHFPNISSINVT